MFKNAKVISFALLLSLAGATPAFAGSIDYLSNQSSDYIRTFSRNAATDGTDTVYYNPAGTTWLAEGLYLNLHTQTVFKEYKINYLGKEYIADDPTPIVPSFFALFRTGDLSIFASFTVPAGGGSLGFEDGVPYLEPLALVVDHSDDPDYGTYEPIQKFPSPANGTFEGSSMYLAPSLGVAYRFFGMLGVSAGIRLISASKSYKGSALYTNTKASLDATKSALGVGGIFGLHFSPIPQLHVAFRYEMQTALEFETESNNANLIAKDNAVASFADGAIEKRHLPAVLGVGIAAHIIPQLSLTASLNWYFIPEADVYEDTTGLKGYTKGYDDDYDGGFDLGFSIESQVIPMLRLSVGYNRSDTGGNKDTYNDFEFSMDSHSICLGGRVTLFDRLGITFAFSATLYDEVSTDSIHELWGNMNQSWKNAGMASHEVAGETFDKSVFALAFGFDWKVF